MNKLSNIWNKLKGKKRNIGILVMILNIALKYFVKEYPADVYDVVEKIGIGIAGFGVADAAGRSQTTKDIIGVAKKIVSKK